MEEEKKEEKRFQDELKEKTEQAIKTVTEQGINNNNIDFLYKAIDIHKDLCNEKYWEVKEEYYMYGNYGEYNDGSYGRRGVAGTGRGRYRDGGSSGSYGRRGVKGTGRGRYRGEEMLDEMMYQYGNYSEGKEMYGADQDTMQSFKYMLKAFKDYYKHLKQEASTSEEVQMLEDTAREMLEM